MDIYGARSVLFDPIFKDAAVSKHVLDERPVRALESNRRYKLSCSRLPDSGGSYYGALDLRTETVSPAFRAFNDQFHDIQPLLLKNDLAMLRSGLLTGCLGVGDQCLALIVVSLGIFLQTDRSLEPLFYPDGTPEPDPTQEVVPGSAYFETAKDLLDSDSLGEKRVAQAKFLAGVIYGLRG